MGQLCHLSVSEETLEQAEASGVTRAGKWGGAPRASSEHPFVFFRAYTNLPFEKYSTNMAGTFSPHTHMCLQGLEAGSDCTISMPEQQAWLDWLEKLVPSTKYLRFPCPRNTTLTWKENQPNNRAFCTFALPLISEMALLTAANGDFNELLTCIDTLKQLLGHFICS